MPSFTTIRTRVHPATNGTFARTEYRFVAKVCAIPVFGFAASCASPGTEPAASPTPVQADSSAESMTTAMTPPTDSTRQGLLPFPIVFYTPETRWAGGAGAVHTFRRQDQERPTVTDAAFIYTQNRQVIASLATDMYTDRYRFYGDVGHEKFPNRFFGIGNETDVDEAYTSRTTSAGFGFERRFGASTYLGASYTWSRTKLIEAEEDGLLASGTIPGAGGGTLSGIGAGVTYDTRDAILATSRGRYARLQVERFDDAFGGDFDFTRLDLDVRHFTPTRPGHVLALQGVVRMTTEGAPFYALGRLGGPDLLRGFREGRYRDRHLLAAQAEYRMPIASRIGWAGFAGAGQVARELGDFSADGFHVAGGVGLRFVVDTRENLSLRIDFGFAQGGESGVYITAGQAF